MSTEKGAKKNPAQCVFDLYNLKFGMTRKEVKKALSVGRNDEVGKKDLLKAGADSVELFFDHEDRLWQVKAHYTIGSEKEAEALVDKMSQDYRFQTPSARVSFELTADEHGSETLYIRYTEANMKRVYLHHMMAVGAAKLAEAEEMEKAIREKEEEEYIPSGPLIF